MGIRRKTSDLYSHRAQRTKGDSKEALFSHPAHRFHLLPYLFESNIASIIVNNKVFFTYFLGFSVFGGQFLNAYLGCNKNQFYGIRQDSNCSARYCALVELLVITNLYTELTLVRPLLCSKYRFYLQ